MASRVGCCRPCVRPSIMDKKGRLSSEGPWCCIHFRVYFSVHQYTLTPNACVNVFSVQTPRVHTVYPYRFSSAPALVSALIVVVPYLNNIVRVKLPYIFINFPDDQIIPELPWWLGVKESACQCRRHMHCVSRSLIWENPTCHRATKPAHHNY